MKRLVLTMVIAMMVILGFAQKWQENKINYFVNAATKEFSLSKDQKATLLKARTAYINASMETNKQLKSGEITQDQKKEKTQSLNQEFNQKLMDLTGKTRNELAPFLDRMREELQNVK